MESFAAFSNQIALWGPFASQSRISNYFISSFCPRIGNLSLSFLDIQNLSKSAKKSDSTVWFFTLKTLKMLILEQNMWKTPFCMKSSFLVWNVFKPVFREKNTTFWKHVISTLHLCWCYLIVFWMQHIFENTSLMKMIFTCWMMQYETNYGAL